MFRVKFTVNACGLSCTQDGTFIPRGSPGAPSPQDLTCLLSERFLSVSHTDALHGPGKVVQRRLGSQSSIHTRPENPDSSMVT